MEAVKTVGFPAGAGTTAAGVEGGHRGQQEHQYKPFGGEVNHSGNLVQGSSTKRVD
jgi:hypothetical protein